MSARDFGVLIERAKAVDLLSIIESYGGLSLKGRRDFAGPCPQCGGKDRFGVNLPKQVFHCRKCSAEGGGVIDFVMFVEGCEFKTAVEILTGGRIESRPAPTQSASNKPQSDNAALVNKLWRARQPVSEGCPVWHYLRDVRGYQGPLPSTLGYLPENGGHPAAMIAAFGLCEEPEPGLLAPPLDVQAVHLTRLTRQGVKLEQSGKPAKNHARAYGRLADCSKPSK
jgi:hypothetical protein